MRKVKRLKSAIKTLKAAFPVTIPVMMGYLFLGATYGMLMADKGSSAVWSLLMSVFVYAGSMQFVAINFFAGGVNWATVIFITFMVNIRHIFYGLSMLEKFKDAGRKKPYLIFSLTDETFSLLCSAKAPEGESPGLFFFFIALLDQLYWVAGSVLGGVAGGLLSFNTKGIDFAMTALFLVIFTEQWESTKNHLPAVAGVLASLVCLLLFGPSNFILPAMIVIAFVLISGSKLSKRESGADENG